MRRVIMTVLLGFLTASAGAWVCAKDGWIAEDWLATWRAASGSIGTWTGTSGNGCCTWGTGQTSTWSVTATVGNHGSQTVTGESRCSSTSGAWANNGNPSTNSGTNCWCKMTSPRAGSWVFDYGGGSTSYCQFNCALNCASNVRYDSGFRGAALK